MPSSLRAAAQTASAGAARRVVISKLAVGASPHRMPARWPSARSSARGGSSSRRSTRVRRAEELGYESVYVTHIASRDSLTVLTRYATVSERVKLGTGVLPIFSRTPASTAQTAATIDEISGGRMVLGLGVSHRVTVENWFDAEIAKPVQQMREYAEIVRAILRGEEPPAGRVLQLEVPVHGIPAAPGIPIYIAALSPNMLRLAGEIGDGVMLWLWNPDYIRETVVPEVTKGRERAGKTMDGLRRRRGGAGGRRGRRRRRLERRSARS